MLTRTEMFERLKSDAETLNDDALRFLAGELHHLQFHLTCNAGNNLPKLAMERCEALASLLLRVDSQCGYAFYEILAEIRRSGNL